MNTQAPTPPAPPAGYSTQPTVPENHNSIKIVGRVNFPSTQLFEATGFIDTGKQFATANCFLMFVPGVPDQSKQSGRTYDQNKKEVMKLAIRDVFALSEALRFAALYGNCDFIVFTDSSKFSGTQQGQGITKQVSVGATIGNNNKLRIFLNYKGQSKIVVVLEKWHAFGLAEQLKTLADTTLKEKFKHDRGEV